MEGTMFEDLKKEYQRPQLIAWGAVRELTQTGGTGGSVIYYDDDDDDD